MSEQTATITEAELNQLRREAEALRVLKEWCGGSPISRYVKVEITGYADSTATCYLGDRRMPLGYGHTYAGIGSGATLREAVDAAFACAEQWGKG